MAIVLLILKIIGVVLLVLLALLLLLMLLPVGIRWSWQEQALSVWLKAGPLSFAVWPRRHKPRPAGEKPPEKEAPKPSAPPGDASKTEKNDAVPTEHAPPPDAGRPAASVKTPAVSRAEKARAGDPAAEVSQPKSQPAFEDGGLPKCVNDRVQAAIAFARRDPMAFAGTALGHVGWFTKRLLKGVRITRLRVWWSITGEEASQTALLFANAMTVSNNLLTYLRQFVTVEADGLWLEPDFAGQQRAKRAVSGQVLTRPGILLLLAARFGWRLWHEPNFQPSDR